jgi:hypothetical protein
MLTLVFLPQDAKKVMLRRNIHSQKMQHLQPDRAAPTKDGDVVDPEPATSIQMSGNVSRKRMLRSRCNPKSSIAGLPPMIYYPLPVYPP